MLTRSTDLVITKEPKIIRNDDRLEEFNLLVDKYARNIISLRIFALRDDMVNERNFTSSVLHSSELIARIIGAPLDATTIDLVRHTSLTTESVFACNKGKPGTRRARCPRVGVITARRIVSEKGESRKSSH